MSIELTAFLEMAHAVRESKDADRALKAVTMTAKSVTRSTQASVRLLDPFRRDLRVAARTGASMHVGGAGRFRASEGLIGWSVTNHEAVLVNDVVRDRRFREKPGQVWMPTGIVVAPIFGEDTVIGVLSAARRDGLPYRQADLDALRLMAEIAAPHLQVALLQEHAERDALTGLYNRRHLERRYRAELELSARHGRPLSVVMLDLDDFKAINDTPGQGHGVGDEVLCEVAARMQRECRASDILCRWGGDEFFLLLPETPASEARDIAGRVLTALSETGILTSSGVLSVRASAGVCAAHPQDDLEAVLTRVDRRLFEAKLMRRGRAAFADDAPFNWANFFENTISDWTPVAGSPTRPPDYTSASGSVYWDTGDGVYRQSDHWGPGTSTCKWLLGGQALRKPAVGYCPYTSFGVNGSVEKAALTRTEARAGALAETATRMDVE